MAYQEPDEVETQLEIPSTQKHFAPKPAVHGEGGTEGIKVEKEDTGLPAGKPEQGSQKAGNRVQKAGKQDTAKQLHFIPLFGIFDTDRSDFGANP
jgi:hypothetical protein